MHAGNLYIVPHRLARVRIETGDPEPCTTTTTTIGTEPDNTVTKAHQLLQTHVSERGDEKSDFGADFAEVAGEGDVVDWRHFLKKVNLILILLLTLTLWNEKILRPL
jgi:hypothetical protein